ncbi:MarR family transcriptional regulator, partial [Salmonella enterica subsp. enterica serovar Anatum]|nr:MarR family transcriptional regulator [Salmonella enterica subsp. enterica serovar Anatum]
TDGHLKRKSAEWFYRLHNKISTPKIEENVGDFRLMSREIVENTCILRPSLTGILTRMERDGLVLRLKPVNDQRKLYVMLTEQGQ